MRAHRLDVPALAWVYYTERLDEAGIEPSVGCRGDSYDNALAETIIGLYKAEVVLRRGLDHVELATLEWLWWFNHHCRLSSIGHVPPVEYEEKSGSHHTPHEGEVVLTQTSLRRTRGGSSWTPEQEKWPGHAFRITRPFSTGLPKKS